MKTFYVSYSVTTSYDTTVKARNAKEAEQKVVEVIGEPLEIESVVEAKTQK